MLSKKIRQHSHVPNITPKFMACEIRFRGTKETASTLFGRISQIWVSMESSLLAPHGEVRIFDYSIPPIVDNRRPRISIGYSVQCC